MKVGTISVWEGNLIAKLNNLGIVQSKQVEGVVKIVKEEVRAGFLVGKNIK